MIEERVPMEIHAAGQEEVALISLRKDYVSRRKWVDDPSSKIHEALVAHFPAQHSCQHCKEEIINAFRPIWPLPTFLRNVDQAISAAIDGCTFYEWLLNFVIRSRPRGLLGTEGFWLKLECLPGSLTDVHSVQFMIGTERYMWPCACFDVFTEEVNAAAPYVSSRPFNSDVGSAASFQLAKRWLAECYATHKECLSSIQGFFPTRLVNLRLDGNTYSAKLISIHSAEYTGGVVYATLSYCWGGDQAIKTTNSSLERHMEGIETSNLGLTLKDGIKVALALGIEFLWIDSLCIIQDDPDDVAMEISRMSEYYENASVCISAAVAASCNEGFLHTRHGKPYHHGPFQLPYRGPDGQTGSVQLVNYADYSSSLEPVRVRAWIMQESLLSPRLLSYSYRNLAWSCRKVNRSDGGPYREWHNFEERTSWTGLLCQRFDCGPIKYWKDLVESYSTRSHTLPKDKLPAISGIAQKYAQIMAQFVMNKGNWSRSVMIDHPSKTIIDLQPKPFKANWHVNNMDGGLEDHYLKYLAGIWHFQPSIPRLSSIVYEQLFWTTPLLEFRFSHHMSFLSEKYSSRLERPSVRRFYEYIAPSWSWAAIDGPILYEDLGRNMQKACSFEILNIGVNVEIKQAPYGAVKSGFLTVKSRMREVSSTREPDEPGIVYRPDTNDDITDLTRIMDGSIQGWLLEVVKFAGDAKPVAAYWNAMTPKGLILVADGKNYRRIGLFSVDKGTGSFNPFSGDALSLFFGEPQTITII